MMIKKMFFRHYLSITKAFNGFYSCVRCHLLHKMNKLPQKFFRVRFEALKDSFIIWHLLYLCNIQSFIPTLCNSEPNTSRLTIECHHLESYKNVGILHITASESKWHYYNNINLSNSCNTGRPDMYTRCPRTDAYICGNALLSVLQLHLKSHFRSLKSIVTSTIQTQNNRLAARW